jgi:hypothetical protein
VNRDVIAKLPGSNQWIHAQFLMGVLYLSQYNSIVLTIELGALWTGRVEKVHFFDFPAF